MRNKQAGGQSANGKQQNGKQKPSSTAVPKVNKLARTLANKERRIEKNRRMLAKAIMKQRKRRARYEVKRQDHSGVLAFLKLNEANIKKALKRQGRTPEIERIAYLKDMVAQMYQLERRATFVVKSTTDGGDGEPIRTQGYAQ